MRTAFQGAVAQTLPVYDLILLLKVARDGAYLASSSRLFQSLGPRKDIALCPLLLFRKGIKRSVSVFRSSLTFRVDLFSNKLERYSGTRLFSDLYTVVHYSSHLTTICTLCELASTKSFLFHRNNPCRQSRTFWPRNIFTSRIPKPMSARAFIPHLPLI